MKRVAIVAAILALIAWATLPPGAQQMDLAKGEVLGEVESPPSAGRGLCFPTSSTQAATQYNYGPVVYVGDAEAVSVMILEQGCGASSTTKIFWEHLGGNPTDAVHYGIYTDYGSSSGLRTALLGAADTEGLSSYSYGSTMGSWSYREQLLLWKDATTTAVSTVVASGNYWAHLVPKGDYGRLVVYNVNAHNNTTLSDGTLVAPRTTAWYEKRNRPWPALTRASETMGTWDEALGQRW